jgi:Protein of unknown function (DUF2917)
MISSSLRTLFRRLGPGTWFLPRPLRLTPGATTTLRAQRGRWLQVQRGRLWLTEPGDPQDHFIGPGQCWRIAGPGPVVLQNDSTETAWCWLGRAAPGPHLRDLDDATLRDIGAPASLRATAGERRQQRALQQLVQRRGGSLAGW